MGKAWGYKSGLIIAVDSGIQAFTSSKKAGFPVKHG
jgi:hypothetical protein